jgi:hypothetical protein
LKNHFFCKKNENKKNASFYVDVCGPKPCILQGILTILGVKKSELLGAIFGPSGTIMLPKP